MYWVWLYKNTDGTIYKSDGLSLGLDYKSELTLLDDNAYITKKRTYVKVGLVDNFKIFGKRWNGIGYDEIGPYENTGIKTGFVNLEVTNFTLINGKILSYDQYKRKLQDDLKGATSLLQISAFIEAQKSILQNKNNTTKLFLDKDSREFTSNYIDTATRKYGKQQLVENRKIFEDELSHAKERNIYSGYVAFYNKYGREDACREAVNAAFNLVVKANDINKYASFLSDFRLKSINNENLIDKSRLVVGRLYSLVEQENNISGYRWFMERYPEVKEARLALNAIHELAFADTESVDTLAAYNDFIIAYPFAPQVQKATDRAYDLEAEKYSGWFENEEKNARALLVKSKQLEREMNSPPSSARDGYHLVIDRMNRLLQDKYPAEEATLRYLESEEFKDFYKALRHTLSNINDTLAKIENNTSDVSSILKNQSRMMESHFTKAAQSREMAAKYTAQHRYWERYIKGKGL